MAVRVKSDDRAEGVREYLRCRLVRLVTAYPRLIATDDPLSVGPSPWAHELARLDAGEPLDAAGWQLGTFRPAGSSPSDRWRVYADGRLEPAPPPGPTCRDG